MKKYTIGVDLGGTTITAGTPRDITFWGAVQTCSSATRGSTGS